MPPGIGHGQHMDSINGGILIAGWLIWKSPIQMDADWGYPHVRKPPYMELYGYMIYPPFWHPNKPSIVSWILDSYCRLFRNLFATWIWESERKTGKTPRLWMTGAFHVSHILPYSACMEDLLAFLCNVIPSHTKTQLNIVQFILHHTPKLFEFCNST